MKGALSLEDLNRALLPWCVEHGECICLSPMRLVVNAAGLRCALCGQVVRDFYYSPEAKHVRGGILAAAFPDLVKQDGPG